MFVQRYLTHTVDSIYGLIAHIGHTVDGSLQHQTATKHTTEVGTLNGIQQTSRIDGTETETFPIRFPKLWFLMICIQSIILIYSNGSSCSIFISTIVISLLAYIFFMISIYIIVVLFFCYSGRTCFISIVTIGIIYLTQILQLKISTFAVGQFIVFFQRNLLIHTIVVGTIVGDVQLTIATHHRQVATAIEAASMLGTHGDKVMMIDIVECCCGITKYSNLVGVGLVTVRRHITTGKYRIIDMHATFNLIIIIFTFTGKELIPWCGSFFLLLQRVQIFCRYILIRLISFIVIFNGIPWTNLQHGRYHHATVFGQFVFTVSIIVMVRRTCFHVSFVARAIDIANVTATEHVTITTLAGCHHIGSTDLTTIDVDTGLSKHIAIRVIQVLAAIAKLVVALAATEHIVQHMTVVHIDIGLTRLVDSLQHAL